MKLEIATADQLDDALALLGHQFREHDIELPPDVLRHAVLGIIDDPQRGRVLIAYDPEPIGIAVLAFTWTLEHGGRVAWLEELFVVEPRRDARVGVTMLHRALEAAAAAGCLAVDLEVDVDHGRAEHLYEREGFRRLPRRRWTKRL
jgi:GNAT superfamily N-acetyltransferase